MNDAKLHEVTRFLHNAAPQEFTAFRKEFEAYTQRTLEVMLEATMVEGLQVMQGRAQQCKAFLRLFNEIEGKRPGPASR